jgi:hypothetical protein
MSRYISKLPPEIRELAEKRRSERVFPSETDKLSEAFDWDNTPEKHLFWMEIDRENYSVFYTIYPHKDKLDELIEWLQGTVNSLNKLEDKNKYEEGGLSQAEYILDKAKEIKDGK